jgi:hypothetical protein
MDGSTWGIMPHIPEAELHAYLDQALNRLRCVEIESHLAECTPCRGARDEIAALRDRTTAMLARLAPRGTVAPPIAEIRRRAAARVFQRERFRQRAAWAASVLVALGVGWGGASYLAPVSSTRAVAPVNPRPAASALRTDGGVPLPTPSQTIATTGPEISATEPPALERRPESVSHRVLPHHPTHQPSRKPDQSGPAEFATSGSTPSDGQAEPGGTWRNPRWERAPEQVANTAARTEGRTAADGQAQPADTGRKAMTVVAQQLRSGEVVRTIEGPVSDVAALFGTRPGEASESSGSVAGSPGGAGAPVGSTFSFRRGDRMLSAPGNLPSDSLRAMMRRLNLMSRVR